MLIVIIGCAISMWVRFRHDRDSEIGGTGCAWYLSCGRGRCRRGGLAVALKARALCTIPDRAARTSARRKVNTMPNRVSFDEAVVCDGLAAQSPQV